jgi:F-type H+-transporting ATPase subunit b
MNVIFEAKTFFSILTFAADAKPDKFDLINSIDLTIILLQMTLFLISYFVLKHKMFPPILDIFIKRQKMIDEANLELKRYELEGQNMELLYQKKIHNARKQAKQIHQQARQEANALERIILDDTRSKITDIKMQRQLEIQEHAEKLRTQLLQSTQSLADSIASKVLERNIKT